MRKKDVIGKRFDRSLQREITDLCKNARLRATPTGKIEGNSVVCSRFTGHDRGKTYSCSRIVEAHSSRFRIEENLTTLFDLCSSISKVASIIIGARAPVTRKFIILNAVTGAREERILPSVFFRAD